MVVVVEAGKKMKKNEKNGVKEKERRKVILVRLVLVLVWFWSKIGKRQEHTYIHTGKHCFAV